MRILCASFRLDIRSGSGVCASALCGAHATSACQRVPLSALNGFVRPVRCVGGATAGACDGVGGGLGRGADEAGRCAGRRLLKVLVADTAAPPERFGAVRAAARVASLEQHARDERRRCEGRPARLARRNVGAARGRRRLRGGARFRAGADRRSRTGHGANALSRC
eukprot:6203383-Pleurochrysis_carterae.AAC.4